MFAVKTTTLASSQFSSPPSPPTLLDAAARWDGNQYTLLPEPKDPDSDSAGGSKMQVSDKPGDKSTNTSNKQKRMVKRRVSQAPPSSAHGAQDLSKRFWVSALVGMGLGAALSPGLPSVIRGNEDKDAIKPPFDPYDPNILKPKEPLAAAAVQPNADLSDVLRSASDASASGSNQPLSSQNGVSPSGYVFPNTVYAQQQPVHSTGYTSADGATSPPADGAQPVLRKRDWIEERISTVSQSEGASSKRLEKRFLFTGGPAGKLAGGVVAGSVIPLLFNGVTHARYRTENPRDRQILEDLDPTPTYGAVGVPGRQPGQLAVNAMPGYREYLARLQAEQQRRSQAALQQQQPAAAAADGAGGAGADAPSGEPVLRRRSVAGDALVGSHEDAAGLEKRGWGSALPLAGIGILLGYAQSMAAFPQNREEERNKRKKEAAEKQEAQMQAQGAAEGDPSASPQGMGAPGGSAYPPSGDGVVFPQTPQYSSAGADGSAFAPTTPYVPSSAGFGVQSQPDTSALSAELNAAAGVQSSGGGGGGSVLKKRDSVVSTDVDATKLETRSLSKRGGFGSALAIGGTTMMFGTLFGNLFVANKQKSKPVPLVTPNADTRGPMIPGGELYAEFLEAKRRGQVGGGGDQDALIGAGVAGGTPASVGANAISAGAPASIYAGQSQAPAYAGTVGGTVGTGGAGSVAVAAGATTAGDGGAVLKKRAVHEQAHLERRLAVAVEAVEAETAAASLLSKGGALAEAETSAAGALRGSSGGFGGLSRASGSASGLARGGAAAAEAGVGGLARTSATAEREAAEFGFRPQSNGLNAARPAMISDIGASGRAVNSVLLEELAGRSGSGSASVRGLSGTAGTSNAQEVLAAERSRAAELQAISEGGDAAAEGAEGATKKKGGVAKALGIIGTAAGATMTFSGTG
ncbi:hypothetical protein L1887_47923 [Cichorium endivia]|nr:hypothetical protein L1887_47923 [Cichorium endivia]